MRGSANTVARRSRYVTGAAAVGAGAAVATAAEQQPAEEYEGSYEYENDTSGEGNRRLLQAASAPAPMFAFDDSSEERCMTVGDLIATTPELSRLKDYDDKMPAEYQKDMTEKRTELQSDDFTFFAPTNAAFKKLEEWLPGKKLDTNFRSPYPTPSTTRI